MSSKPSQKAGGPHESDSEQGHHERLQQPLNVLKDISQKLLQQKIPTTPARLDELYSHLQSIVTDVFDYVETYVEEAKDKLLEAAGAAQTDESVSDEDREALGAFQEDLNEAQTVLKNALDFGRQTFFSASNFQELQARQTQLLMLETQLESGIQGLEMALMRLDDPELLHYDDSTPDEIADVIDNLGNALFALEQYMNKNDRTTLQRAYDDVRVAGQTLQALLDAQP